jgi:multidrug efflux system membrane fusion protein
MDRTPQKAAPVSRRPVLLRHPWFWVVLLLLAGTGYWYWSGHGSTEDAKGPGKRGGPTPVLAATAKKGDMPVYLRGLGSVLPESTVTVKSRVDGQLMALHFREGQVVKAGDLLAEIDPRPFQVQLTQMEGQYAKDEALLKNARLDAERYRVLLAQDSIAKQQLDTQEALVRQYQGSLKSDQGQVDNARLQLTYARITAPAAGRLGLRQVDAGNIVHASDANGLVVITRLQPINVVFSLPEDNLPGLMKRVSAGEKLPVDAWDREQKSKLAGGSLLTVDNQIDATTGTVKLKAKFANDDYALFPNQFVNARLLLETRKDVTLIPASAIQRGQQNSTFVYVIKDKSVSVRPVKLGPSEGETVAIDSGLAPGEQVVADGGDKLREGAKVEVQAPDGGKAPGGHPKGEGRPARDPAKAAEWKKKRGGE